MFLPWFIVYALDRIWWHDDSDGKYMLCSGKINESTSQLITCTMEVSEFEKKNPYLDAVKFKNEDQKFLGKLLIFTPIPLNAQDVWSLNQFPMRE